MFPSVEMQRTYRQAFMGNVCFSMTFWCLEENPEVSVDLGSTFSQMHKLLIFRPLQGQGKCTF